MPGTIAHYYNLIFGPRLTLWPLPVTLLRQKEVPVHPLA